MIRTLLFCVLLSACILIGIGFVGVPFLNHYHLGTPLTVSRIAYFGVTGFIIIIGSVRALISVTHRSRF
jgi:hypothetical protein